MEQYGDLVFWNAKRVSLFTYRYVYIENSSVINILWICSLLQSINDYEQAIDDYRWKCEACQVSVNPVILAVGEDIKTVDTFYVHFERFNYRFDSFLAAFSVCFKMYSVLNLQFLRPSESMWSFVEQYFFDISDGSNCVRSTVLSVFLNDMRNWCKKIFNIFLIKKLLFFANKNIFVLFIILQ